MGHGGVGALDAAQARSVLLAAISAPSPYDSQPWLFSCTRDLIELYGDQDRAHPDPDRRELLLACGAALCNLRLAIQSLGVRVEVHPFPTPGRPDLLATVRPFGHAPVAVADRMLAETIPHCPPPWSGQPVLVAAPLLNRLRQAAESERTWLAVLDRAQTSTLRGLAQRAGRRKSGLNRRSGLVPDTVIGEAGTEPLVVVVGSFHDLPPSRLQAGQATQRVLLTAASAGLPACFLPSVIEVPDTRRALRTLIGGGLWPQVVLLIGAGSPRPPVPRRPLDDVASLPH